MARTGDEEGEGQEAQEGSRRLISHCQTFILPIRPNLLPLPNMYPLACTQFVVQFFHQSRALSSIMLSFIPLSLRSVHHTSKVPRTSYLRSSTPSIVKYAL